MTCSIRRLPDMPRLLLELLAQLPRGRVTTHGRLAKALGDVIASRWVGHFVLHHEHRPGCVCHRVVRAGGELGSHVSGNVAEKARLLGAEGVRVCHGWVDVDRYAFDAFISDRPLVRLQELQEQLLEKLSLKVRVRRPQLVGGVDISYARNREGVAAYALVELRTGRLVWSTTIRSAIRFPYITSFLAFRELPLLLELLDEVRDHDRQADVLLVDGSGIMHPRHAGIATHLGIATDIPTVGVTKKLLCGQVDLSSLPCGEPRPVVHDGRTLGVALRPVESSRRPLFVSPGHLIDVPTAAQLVRRLLTGRRLPEPTYWADRLSRAQARRSD